MRKVTEHLRPARRMHDFGVKLRAVEMTRCIPNHGIRSTGRRCENVKPWRHFGNMVSVAHPYFFLAIMPRIKHIFKQGSLCIGLNKGAAKFAAFALRYCAAQLSHHCLLTVTYTKDWYA